MYARELQIKLFEHDIEVCAKSFVDFMSFPPADLSNLLLKVLKELIDM